MGDYVDFLLLREALRCIIMSWNIEFWICMKRNNLANANYVRCAKKNAKEII